MALSAASVLQARTGSASAVDPATVTLDSPTTPGGTVIVEMYGPAQWPGMPPGWEFDAVTAPASAVWVFRYSGGPGGETSWDFHNFLSAATNWVWRVTEWDATLDPVSPLDATPGVNALTSASVPTLSTGTSGTNVRAESVALATHLWSLGSSAPAKTVTFSAHTNGFTERANTRVSFSGQEISASWSWLFNSSPGSYECTATVTNSAPTTEGYYGMVVCYAATVPVVLPAPQIMVTG